ncbi:unnamed protein product [Ostreobium quekettii]|uniref:NET domain-containing protein n=1 Tax=Ostreobium quekettii TaxID=121088 RepID=A0A8S1J9L7_9CHLO|nr:unnamed protein product [Ostreobium quekettii]
MDACGRELEELTRELASASAAIPASQDNEDAAFPFILRRQLSHRLEGAKGDGEPYHFKGILDILASSSAIKSTSDLGKPECFDINLLDNPTLWRLQRMVKLAQTVSSEDGDGAAAPATEAAAQPANGSVPLPSSGADVEVHDARPSNIPSTADASVVPPANDEPSPGDEALPGAASSPRENQSPGSNKSSRENVSPGSNPAPDPNHSLDANTSQEGSPSPAASPSPASDGGGTDK